MDDGCRNSFGSTAESPMTNLTAVVKSIQSGCSVISKQGNHCPTSPQNALYFEGHDETMLQASNENFKLHPDLSARKNAAKFTRSKVENKNVQLETMGLIRFFG